MQFNADDDSRKNFGASSVQDFMVAEDDSCLLENESIMVIKTHQISFATASADGDEGKF